MIAIRHLTKTFGKLRVLDDVSLRLERGQCIALIGPNGCGKTTLIKSMLGMAPPSAGQILFQGQDIARQWLYRRHIGYMPQIGRYPENMSIGQVLAMMRDIRQMPEHLLDRDLFDAFGLADMLGKRMGTLSGGTRQKVSACLAFMFGGEMYILDEPTAGLDPAERNRFHRVLADVATDAVVLLSTHIVEDVENLCQRLAILAGGKIVAEGTPAELAAPLQGRLWSKIVPRTETLPEAAIHLSAAPTGTLAVIQSDTAPGAGYQPHAPCLEDAYHHALAAAGIKDQA